MLRNELRIGQAHFIFYSQGEHGIYIPVDAGKPYGFTWSCIIQFVGQGDALIAGMAEIGFGHVYLRLTSSIAILVEWLNGPGSVMGFPIGL